MARDGSGDDTEASSPISASALLSQENCENVKRETQLLRANDKLSKVGTVHYTAYDGRGICEMSFEAILGLIFCKIEA